MKKTVERIQHLLKQGKKRDAHGLATRLTVDYSNESTAWRERAFVRTLQGRHKAAIGDLDKAIALSHFRSLADTFSRGRSWFALQKYRKAAADFTQVIVLSELFNLDSHRLTAMLFRADCYIRLKRIKEAAADCRSLPSGFSTWTDKIRRREDLLGECGESSKRRRHSDRPRGRTTATSSQGKG